MSALGSNAWWSETPDQRPRLSHKKTLIPSSEFPQLEYFSYTSGTRPDNIWFCEPHGLFLSGPCISRVLDVENVDFMLVWGFELGI